ncbi:UDP-glucose 4-epimerase GalE [Demequina sp. NBRC 110055]|uniref:UDP-glucose 4-epimerase GalE n=1 Tax=Demequina sp. NBRC 110055 TaxID=1570344 RepID=UPI0009FBF812|nr:UDP-glucose 4-epimerase GalE [Demequina sp. NBRC 110055]
MSWMVTGGAGYIGSHVVRALTDGGIDAVVLDDLSSGFEQFIPAGVPFVKASILETDKVREALVEHSVQGVIHCAGYKYAGESVRLPIHTYRQNVEGTACLLEAMADAGVTQLVFSSSAGVYGTPDVEIVNETTPTTPESPYGESKLIGEWLIRDQVKATAESDAPLRATSLRYFNVVGSGTPEVYDASPHNLFPKVIRAIKAGQAPLIFGDDYDTEDGTCVRDYVHVQDLAHSHVAAARMLDAGRPLAPVYNLGSGDGTSVKEIVGSLLEAAGSDLEPVVKDRRPGDPARIVARGELAADDIEWKMAHTIEEMASSAWEAAPDEI